MGTWNVEKKIRNNKKRSVTLLRAHNNMLAQIAK
jgi:hypothetical protein